MTTPLAMAGSDPTTREPRWVASLVRGLIVAVTAFAVVAAPLLMLEAFHPAIVFPAWGALAVALWMLSRDHVVRRPSRPAHLAGAAALLVVTGAGAWNAAHASTEVFTFRDPAVYTTAARDLADTGTVRMDTREGPFDREDLNHHAVGYYDSRDDGRLFPQFFHLLTGLMAVGAWLGGDTVLFAVNAVVGAAALLLFYALAARVVRPAYAVGAVVALAFTFPQLYFSRGAYSEVVTQLLLFGGLWLLWSSTPSRARGAAFVAGLTLGATAIARIDAFLFFIPLAAWGLVEAVHTRSLEPDDRRRHRRRLAAAAGGTALTAGLGLAHGLVLSPDYVRAHEDRIILMLLAAGVLSVAAVIAATTRLTWRSLGQALRRRRNMIARLGAGAVIAGAGFAAVLRPVLEEATFRGGQRSYVESTFEWMAWYLGWPLMAAAVVGLAIAVHRVVGRVGTDVHPAMPLLGVFFVSAVLYLWNPRITPDHIWAMRRFLPVILPGWVLFGALALEAAERRLGSWPRRARDGTLVGAAALIVVPIVAISAPFLDFRQQRPEHASMEAICDAVGDDASVVVLRGRHLHDVLPAAINSFCGVPVAAFPHGGDPAILWDLETQWAAEGRKLHLVGVRPEQLAAAGVPRLRLVHRENAHSTLLDGGLGSRPDDTQSLTRDISVMRLPEQPS